MPDAPAPFQPTTFPLFSEAILLVLKRWSGYQMALDYDDSVSHKQYEHREGELHELLVDFYAEYQGQIPVDELESNLEGYFEDTFPNIGLDDGSIKQTSVTIARLFRDIVGKGQLDELEKLRAAVGRSSSSNQRRLLNENGEETSDEEVEAEEEQVMSSHEPMDSEMDAMEDVQAGPIVDDDGFELVQKKTRKARR